VKRVSRLKAEKERQETECIASSNSKNAMAVFIVMLVAYFEPPNERNRKQKKVRKVVKGRLDRSRAPRPTSGL